MALAIGMQSAALAGGTAVKGFHAKQLPSSALTTKAGSIVVNTANPESSLSAGAFTTVDTETVNCASKKGCVLVMNVMDQIYGGGSGEWAIVVSVDGTYVDGGPYQGNQPASGVFVTGNWTNYYQVATGSHTVTVQTYVEDAAGQYRWSDTIGIGKGTLAQAFIRNGGAVSAPPFFFLPAGPWCRGFKVRSISISGSGRTSKAKWHQESVIY